MSYPSLFAFVLSHVYVLLLLDVCLFLRRDKKVVDGDGRKGRGVGRRHYKKYIFHEKNIFPIRVKQKKNKRLPKRFV